MALDSNKLAKSISDNLSNAFSEMTDEIRLKFSSAIASAIIEHFQTNAEILVPDHDKKMTDAGGQYQGTTTGGQAFVVAPHRHLVENLKHPVGTIK